MLQYSFSNVDLRLNLPDIDDGLTISGYSSGEGLITCTRRAPIAETTFGARGEMVVSMQRIIAGDLTFSLLMASSDNAKLQQYANKFQGLAKTGTSEFPSAIGATMKDKMGDDQCHMFNGVILAMPAMTRGQIASVVTWTITFESMIFLRDYNDGTNVVNNQFFTA